VTDYFTPTVVEPEIPDADMTPLERLLLSHIFETERYDGRTYLFSALGPSDMIDLPRSELVAALAASERIDSSTNAFVKEQLAAGNDASEIEFDMSVSGWQFIFQDIVRRSPTIPYVIVKSAFTCSKMRADGFGGMAMLITADDVLAKSTYDLIEAFEARVKASPTDGGSEANTADRPL